MYENDLKFIRNLYKIKDPLLKNIEEYANKNYIPIAKPEVIQFLKTMIRLKKPKRMLEIGTAIGYSAINMIYSSENAKLVTIERDIDIAGIAKENFKKALLDDRIDLIIGDAVDVIPNLSNMYDLIFIDAAKGHYMDFFNQCLKILNDNGIVICDNVLYKGYISNETNVKHKRRTIVYRIRDFLDKISKMDGLETTIISIGDGVSLSVKYN